MRAVPEALLAPNVTLTMRKPYAAWGVNTHATLTRFVVAVAVPLSVPAPLILPPGGPVVSISTYVELSTKLSAGAAVGVPVAELVPEEEGVPNAEALPDADAVALAEAVADAVGEGAQKGSSVEPAAQEGVHTQGAHVAMEDAPSAGEKVPTGHSVGSTEDSGQ